MPEYLRALIVILVLASVVFYFARRSAPIFGREEDFVRRRNLWFAFTLVAFLTANFWIYTFAALLLLQQAKRRDQNPIALFFFLLLLMPVANVAIPGFGLVNQFFDLTHARILTLFILLPLYFSLRRQAGTLRFGRSTPDKWLAAYLILLVLLYMRNPNVTNNLRQDFYLFVDIFLLYFVISRTLKTIDDFRDVLYSLVVGIMIVAVLAVFESYKHWLLYATLTEMLKVEGSSQPLGRDGLLRAMVTTEQPIVLGYVMVVGLGFYLFLQQSIRKAFDRWSGLMLLIAGLLAALSRGPWIGAVLLMVVFLATGRKALRRMLMLGAAGLLALSVVSVLPGGERYINLLPFIGTTESENITYREQLITNSLAVIERNLLFGTNDFLETPEMEEMRQGQGIIDVVNSYIAITLKSGLAGLTLFAGFFMVLIAGVLRSMRGIHDKQSEAYLLGRVLVAIICAILLIIFTVSSITFIPILYWSIAGMAMAYMEMVRKSASK